MPLDIGECINNAADAMLKAPFMHTVASNPIYTAMIIVFIVMLITLVVFRDSKSESSILIMTLRSGFWIFLATMGIIFMHNKVLTADTEESAKGYEGLFEEMSTRHDAVPINIPGTVTRATVPSFDVSKLVQPQPQQLPQTPPQPQPQPQQLPQTQWVQVQPQPQPQQPVVSPVNVTISVPSK